MKASVIQLTLDTNLIHEYFKQRPKVDLVNRLIQLATEGRVDLAVTARIHEDIPKEPLASRLNELPELGIAETGSVARLCFWVLGRDVLGSDSFVDFWHTARKLARERVGDAPDWRDEDHLHAHLLAHRDVFLTWDKAILCIAAELRDEQGIRVMSPEDFLQSLHGDAS